MQFKHVTLDFDGPVAILKLDHQEVMNAVSMDMLGGLGEALDEIDTSEEVRCLVLTGAGRAFCTGANLSGRNDPKAGRATERSLETGYHPFLRRLRRLPCPMISAVNGPAAGAGMSIALMGDMIVCARSSYFLQAFRRIGEATQHQRDVVERHEAGALDRELRLACGLAGLERGPEQRQLILPQLRGEDEHQAISSARTGGVAVRLADRWWGWRRADRWHQSGDAEQGEHDGGEGE